MLEFTLKFLSGDSRKYEVDESVSRKNYVFFGYLLKICCLFNSDNSTSI